MNSKTECRVSLHGVLQNPVITLAWQVTDFCLIGPLLSLSVDTKLFCESALRSRPLQIMALAYTAITYILILVNPASYVRILPLYSFSLPEREYLALILTAEAACYYVLIRGSRRVLAMFQQRKLHPM